MPRRSLTAGLLLLALAACKPGESANPSSRGYGLEISGTVLGGVSADVLVRAAGPVAAVARADYAGRFRFTGLPRGEYWVHPVGGATSLFSPAGELVRLFDRDVAGLEFTGNPAAAIEGTVFLGAVGSGTGVGGVPVTLVGPVTVTVGTDAAGHYLAGGLPGGEYSVAPGAIAGRLVQPVAAPVTATAQAIARQDFGTVAWAGATHGISGRVTGPVVSGLPIDLYGSDGTWLGRARSGVDGRYSFAGLQDAATYTVTTQATAGLLLRRRALGVRVEGGDVTNADFEVYVPQTARWLYVAATPVGGAGTSLHQYGIDLLGAPSAFPANPTVSVNADGAASALAVDPTGHHLYLADKTRNLLYQFDVGDDGQLAPMATASVATASQPTSLAIDPSGGHLWVHHASGDLWTFDLGADGALSATPSSTLTVGGGSELVAHPTAAMLYLVSTGGIQEYAVGADGAPSYLATAAVAPAGASVTAMAIDPSGLHAYATAIVYSSPKSAFVARLDLDAQGLMSQVGTGGAFATIVSNWDGGPAEVLVEPSGRFAYVGSALGYYTNGSALMQYGIDPLGAISALDPLSTDGGGSRAQLATDPGGHTLYAVNWQVPNLSPTSSAVAWRTIGANGQLSGTGSLATGLGATALVVVSR